MTIAFPRAARADRAIARIPRAVGLAAATIVAACGAHPRILRPVPAAQTREVALCDTAHPCERAVELTYLGVGGWVVRQGGSAVMTAPSFTYPNPVRAFLPFVTLRTDEQLARDRLRAASLAGLDAILVGHAHYDHLMDVPFVAREFARDVPVYGSRTMRHILAGNSALARVARFVPPHAARDQAASWIYAADRSMRYLPLRSTHAPNFWRWTFANRSRSADRTSLPRTPRGWSKGEVYAWLIDLLGPDGTPTFRIYYQDSAADSVSVDEARLTGADARRVDLAILCVGNYSGVPDNPDVALRRLDPRFVVLGHWENFFRNGRDSLRIIPLTRAKELVQRMDSAAAGRWIAPEPTARLVLRF